MNFSITIGTLGGTLTIFLMNISLLDMERTFVLTSIGAVSSFLVSMAMKYIIKKWWK